jgi:TP901 family phage tail tape measure protein
VASKYSIETVFKLIDRVTAPTSKIDKALNKIGLKSKAVSNALKHDFDKAAARVDKLGASMKKWGGRAVLGGIAAIGAGVGLATKQFIEFDTQLYKAGSIFSDLDSRANDFQTRLDRIGKAARDVAAATEFNAEQTARALSVMAMAGIKSSQAISLLPKVADMATAASMDLDQAVGMAAGALNVFGKMVDDPLKLAENFQYVSDVMVRGANLANMSLSDMSASISAGGARFKDANQRIEDCVAAIDILASVNKRGAEAGNAISAIMTQLAAKPGNVSKALQELGIRTQDTQGNMLNFVDIMGQLNVAMKGMGTAKQDEYLFKIFGKNRMNYARPLIDAGVEGFRAYSRELEQAAGSTQQAAEVMRKSIKNKLAVLGSAATELGFKFVEAFKGKAVSAIESATKAIEKIDVTPLVEFATAAGNGIMKFAGILSGAAKIAWQFRGVIVAILGPIIAYNLVFMVAIPIIRLFTKLSLIATIVMGTQATALGMLKKGTVEYLIIDKLFIAATKIKTILLMVLTKGTLAQSGALAAMAVANKTATISQWLLNAAMNANPIGLVVVAIAALVVIIAALVKWGHKAAAVFITVAGVLLGPLAVAVGFIISVFVELIKGWGSVTKAFKDGGILAGLKQIGALLFSGILGPIQGLLELLAKIPGADELLGPAVKGLNDFRNKLKGIDTLAIEAEVKTPETEFDKLTKEFGIAMPEMPDMNIPGLDMPGFDLGGMSKLHGVVDISGGIIPTIDNKGTYTTEGAINSISPPTGETIITRAVTDIAGSLRNISDTVLDISRAVSLPVSARSIVRSKLPAIAAPEAATRMSLLLPKIDMSGGEDEDGPGYHDPRQISPITQAERMVYNLAEQRVLIEVAAERGTAARIVRAPRDVDIKLVRSGGNA